MHRRPRYRGVLTFILVLAITVIAVPGFAGAPPTENKPLVLVVYADWCPLCQKLKPALALINEKYSGRIRFVRLDVTSEETTAKSKQRAQSLGLEQFFDKYHDTTSLVIIQDASGHEVFRALHDYDFQHYAKVLDQLLRTEQAK
jgi:thiol-disulfide isomerase/thioredoxin